MIKYGLFILLVALSFCKKEEKKLPDKAVVSFVVGEAYVQTAGKVEKKISQNFVIFPKDKIITSKNSYLDLQITEDIKIRIRENTSIILESIFLSSKDDKVSVNFKLENGKIFSKINGKLSKDSSFQIQTKTFVAGVRGTEFITEETNESSKTLVSDGSVSMDLLDKEGKPIGKETIIENGNKGICINNTISETKLTEDELKELNSDSTTISSIKADALAEIEKILKTVDDQKSVNEQILNSQKEKNKDELNTLKETNSKELNELKQKNQENLEEVKSKTISEKEKIKSEQDSEKEKIKDSGSDVKSSSKSALEELKEKNKLNLPPK